MVEIGIGYCKEREGEVCDGSGGGKKLEKSERQFGRDGSVKTIPSNKITPIIEAIIRRILCSLS